ncbi:MAG: PDGLE domain-containing protein [Chloroflexi bacterium]|nr:PDGLE domain-containing protein [Chloroflexota bacterium]
MRTKWWLITLGICLALAIISPLASSQPDGLERVAEDQGFLALARPAPFRVISDYLFPGVENETAATILAGVTGTLLMFAAAYSLARLLARRPKRA